MSEMISWKSFKSRRKLDLKSVVKSHSLYTYEAAVAHFNNLWVEAPPRADYDEALQRVGDEEKQEVSRSKIPTLRDSKTSKTKAPAKKTSGRRKTSASKKKPEDNPDEVWEDGLDGSYSEKKTTRKTSTRKTSTRKTSTRKKT